MKSPTDYKFPKIEDRLKRSQQRTLGKTSHSISFKLDLKDKQKEKMLKLNGSLASKFFLHETCQSVTPKSSSPVHPTSSKIPNLIWRKELDKINVKLVEKEIDLLKKGSETLAEVQEEFFVYKEYVEEVSSLFGGVSEEIKRAIFKGVQNLVKVFGKITRKYAQSSIVVPVAEKPEIKSKFFRNSAAQTDSLITDNDWEELEGLKQVNERLKNLKIPKIVDKLLDVKQSIIDMHSVLPNISEKPELDPGSYKMLLKLIHGRLSLNKTDAETSTDPIAEIQKITEAAEVSSQDISQTASDDLEGYKAKVEELENTLALYKEKTFILESKLFELGRKEGQKPRKNIEIQTSASPLDQDLANKEDLKAGLLECSRRLNELEQAYNVKSDQSMTLHSQINSVKERIFKIGVKENLELGQSTNSISLLHKKNKEKIAKLHPTASDSTEASKHPVKESEIPSGIELNFLNTLTPEQVSQFLAYKDSLKSLNLSQSFLNVTENSKYSQTQVFKAKHLIRNFTENQPGFNFEDLQTLPEIKAFLSQIFQESELSNISQSLKEKLSQVLKDHLNKKCGPVCEHLLRALALKKKELSKPYPISKIDIKVRF